MDPRCGRVTLALGANLASFGDNQPRRGPLLVVKRIQGLRHIPISSPVAGEGSHHNPVREFIAPKLDRGKQILFSRHKTIPQSQGLLYRALTFGCMDNPGPLMAQTARKLLLNRSVKSYVDTASRIKVALGKGD
jgi:hypothetical protein